MNNITVYGLYSTRDGELRYIGQTTQALKSRLRQHRSYAKSKITPVHKWFSREVLEGYEIEIKPICENAVLHQTEIELIAHHRKLGARLLNLTDGGEGTIGWHGNLGNKRPDLAERNRKNKGKPGHPMTAEHKEKLIAAIRLKNNDALILRNKTNHPWVGKKHTAETKAKISAAQIGKVGKKASEETKAKMRAAKVGHVSPPHVLEALRAGHKAYYSRKNNDI